jgi:hypothetical protein
MLSFCMPLPVNSSSDLAAARISPRHGFVHLAWKAHRFTSAEFRAALEQLLQALHASHTGKAFVDQRHMAPIAPADQEWVLRDWLPRAAQQAGYRYAAVLPSQEVYARLASANVVMRASGRPLYQWFEDEATAVAWLLSQGNPA